MSDVLLATSYQLALDPKQQRLMKPYPPLATLTAAAYLREVGHHVAISDSMFQHGISHFESSLERLRPSVVALYEDSFNWLNKMCLSNMREVGLAQIRAAVRRNIPVVVSGPDASDHPELYLEVGARAVISGEGEITLAACVEVLAHGGTLEDIPGLILAAGKRTPPRPALSDLDRLPFAAWDLIDIEPYRHAWKKKHGYFSLNQITTRGCPFRCNWCAKPTYGDHYVTRSPARVVEELALQKRLFQPDHIWYADDILGLKKSWLLEFADRVEAAHLQLPFMCQTRVDLMTEKNVAALRRAGCDEVWMGAESGSTKVLDAMEKGITPDETRAAVERLRHVGIRVALFLQLGYPGEEWDDIQLTRQLVGDTLPDELGISVSYPLPGTRFYERVVDSLQEKTNWRHSDDLDPLFPGIYSAEFYRCLHTLIHAEHRSHLGLSTLRRFLTSPNLPSRRDLRQVGGLAKHLPGFAMRRIQVELMRRREDLTRNHVASGKHMGG